MNITQIRQDTVIKHLHHQVHMSAMCEICRTAPDPYMTKGTP